jgi:hypothetical protein
LLSKLNLYRYTVVGALAFCIERAVDGMGVNTCLRLHASTFFSSLLNKDSRAPTAPL